jgi:ribonuclease BN (tRNA processing enzyme)
MFGTWAGGWHDNLRVYGPSGRTPEYGTAKMVEGMKMFTGWHRDAFSVFPVGKGWDIEVHEFDFRDNGGVVYEKNGVKVIHWQRSHAKDGASGYRLDWNGLCFTWTGDGRPSKLDAKYAKGCDVYVTEQQPELVEISSGVQGVPPFLARYTIDTHHTPGYAAGYLANEVQPRLFMTTHMPFDPYLNEEAVAEVREHWNGPFHFGAPDGIVVNVTKEQVWVREGILPDYPNSRAPQFDFTNGQLVVPHPPTSREKIQEPFVREQQIDPKECRSLQIGNRPGCEPSASGVGRGDDLEDLVIVDVLVVAEDDAALSLVDPVHALAVGRPAAHSGHEAFPGGIAVDRVGFADESPDRTLSRVIPFSTSPRPPACTANAGSMNTKMVASAMIDRFMF